MAGLSSGDLAYWLRGCRSLLPPDVISFLETYVRERKIAGDEFGHLLDGQKLPEASELVTPQILTTLQRIWSADKSRQENTDGATFFHPPSRNVETNGKHDLKPAVLRTAHT